jgi:membrane protease subunit (stomatin/prohibitin family)
LVKLVGAASRLDRETLVKHFRGLLLTRIHDLISTYLIHKKISVAEVNARLDEISGEMGARVPPMFNEYGVEVLNFFVNSINVPEEDPAVAELKKTLTERAKMEVLGYSYQQMRSFDALEKAASDEGGGNLINAGLGLGVGVGMGGAFLPDLRKVRRAPIGGGQVLFRMRRSDARRGCLSRGRRFPLRGDEVLPGMRHGPVAPVSLLREDGLPRSEILPGVRDGAWCEEQP